MPVFTFTVQPLFNQAKPVMPSLKVILHSKVYSDGTRAVMLQLIFEQLNRRQFKRETICRIDPKYWNAGRIRSSHPNHVALNQLIASEYNKAEEKLLDIQRSGIPVTAEGIFEKSKVQTGLLVTAKLYIERLRGRGSYHSAEKYSSHVSRMELFQKGADISLDAIDEDWVLRFVRWLKANGTKSDNTLRKRMQFLGTIYHDARKRGITTNDPLKLLNFPKAQVRKPRLTVEQIATLETLVLEGALALTRDTFLLQFYLYGSRISDVLLLKTSNLQRGTVWRIEYTSMKTGDLISVPLRGNALTIVQRYYDPHYTYLLPWMTRTELAHFSDEQNTKWIGNEVESRSAQINAYLKELAPKADITVNLTTHVARHTFARMADGKVADKRKISAALGHSRFSTTEQYLEDLRMSDLDDDMSAVYQ